MANETGKNRDLRTLPQVVAEREYLTIRWLRRLIYEGRVPSYKLGGKVLVDLEEIDSYVEASRRDTTGVAVS